MQNKIVDSQTAGSQKPISSTVPQQATINNQKYFIIRYRAGSGPTAEQSAGIVEGLGAVQLSYDEAKGYMQSLEFFSKFVNSFKEGDSAHLKNDKGEQEGTSTLMYRDSQWISFIKVPSTTKANAVVIKMADKDAQMLRTSNDI